MSEDQRVALVQVNRSDALGSPKDDFLAVEEPLEIRLVHLDDGDLREKSISITMRTPGHDYELATGFLHGEGIIRGRSDLRSTRPVLPERPGCNIVRVPLAPGTAFDSSQLERHFYTTSSCGVCGKASLEALQEIADPRLRDGIPRVSGAVIASLPQKLRQSQAVFERTGGLHAAAIFSADGQLRCLREDVGRHNAVDKAIGRAILEGELPLRDSILMVSGRTSFEILQKALVAEIPILAAVSAPSSLAVEVAREFGTTLLGFVRAGGFNVYADRGRILSS